MTIYTATTVEKKDTTVLKPPQVVLDDIPDLQFKKTDEVDAFLLNNPANEAILFAIRRRKRRNLLYLLFMLVSLLVVALGIICAVKLYRIYNGPREYHNWCGVTYLDQEERYYEFHEDVKTDAMTYEQIDVPMIDNFNRATILHDFEVNYTAIVDRENDRCFLKPLNRSQVQPPKDFWDLISKLRNGYYLPDEEEIRENYRVVQPPVFDLKPYGPYIWSSCYTYNTYSIEQMHAGMALVKRSVCPMFNVRSSAGKVVTTMKIMDC